MNIPAQPLFYNSFSQHGVQPAMRVMLVDDEPLALARLEAALAETPDIELVGSAVEGLEAARLIASLRPDVVVLDIQMPGLSGIELAESLGANDWRPEIIFVTAFNRFAIEAFHVEAIDYLLKPVSFDRFRVAIERARRRIALLRAESHAVELSTVIAALREDAVKSEPPPDNAYDSGVWVPYRQGAIRIDVDTIDWIEAARDYVLLNTSTKTHIYRAKISDLERRIDPRVIMRVHRSHMVRLKSVVAVEKPGKGALRLLLSDGANVPVGPAFHDQVLAALRL